MAKKNLIRRSLYAIGAFLVAVIFSCNFSGLTAAALEVDSGVKYMPNVEQVLTGEAKANIIANVFRKCMLYNRQNNDPDGGDEVYDPDEWFTGSASGVGFNVGAFMELTLSGEIDDGFIYCYDGGSLFTKFADYMRLDNVDYVFCNPDGGPGMAHIDEAAGRCNQNGELKNSDYEFVANGGAANSGAAWDQYLKSIYEARAKGGKPVWENGAWRAMTDEEKAAAGYATEDPWFGGTWGCVGNYDKNDSTCGESGGYMAYGMYVLEIHTGCGNETNSTPHSSNMLKRLDDTGAYWNTFISGDDSSYPVPGTHDSVHWSFAEWGGGDSNGGWPGGKYSKTCNQFIGHVADFTDLIQPKMFELIESGCEKAFKAQADEWTLVKDNEDSTDEQKEYAEAAINEYNTMVTSGTFTKTVTNDQNEDGKKCKDVEYLTPVEQAEWSLDQQDETDTYEPDCYTNAGSLGWILCPIINQGGEFVTMIYEKMIEPFLVLDSSLFDRTSTGGSATYKAWSQFQTYANIAFIAVFLIVIFSQLTGYGIDNYGIKKILPKLIAAALLINLSYIICQLAVDIANICGYGLKGILDSIGTVDIASMTTSEAPTAHPGAAVGATAILVGLVALITVPAILSQGTAILVPVFIAIVGIVIAVFTLFCLLAVRKAFSVVLVVISPLAFLCYMLPNTKKLFDKWFTAFKAVLIAFPICSAMVYGGQAVARIIVQAAGGSNMPFLMVLSAAVMSIAPVFLIPGTLKKSMGAISGAIDRVSRGASHRARGGIARSNIAHDLQRRGQLQRAGVKVGKDGKVQLTNRGKLQNKMPFRSAASKQRLDAMRADAVKSMGTTALAGSYMGAKGLEKMNSMYSSAQLAQSKQRVSDLEAAINSSSDAMDIDALQGKLTEAIKGGDVDAVKAYQNVLTSKGEPGRQAVRNAMLATKGSSGADYEAGVKAYAQNIMENHQGAYKEKDRSVYEFAKSAQATGTGMISDSINTSKLTGESISGMDDDAFARLQNQGIDTNMQSAAYAALHSEGANKMESGRRTALEKMVEGYTPPDAAASSAASSTSASNPAPAPAPESSSSASGSVWSKMTEEQKKAFHRANPRREGESTAEYAARIQQETGVSIGKQKPQNT